MIVDRYEIQLSFDDVTGWFNYWTRHTKDTALKCMEEEKASGNWDHARFRIVKVVSTVVYEDAKPVETGVKYY